MIIFWKNLFRYPCHYHYFFTFTHLICYYYFIIITIIIVVVDYPKLAIQHFFVVQFQFYLISFLQLLVLEVVA